MEAETISNRDAGARSLLLALDRTSIWGKIDGSANPHPHMKLITVF